MAGSKKIAMKLPTDPGELRTRCEAAWPLIKARFQNNTYPPASEVEQELKVLAVALTDAEDGDAAAVKVLGVAANKVRATFNLLGRVAERMVMAGPAQEASGTIASMLMYESQVGQRGPKPELEVKDGEVSTTVLIIALAVESALTYMWEYSFDNVSWSLSRQSGQSRCTLTGLTPGRVHYFRFRAFLRNGTTTDPSVVVPFLVK
jgi:hypothetical protein